MMAPPRLRYASYLIEGACPEREKSDTYTAVLRPVYDGVPTCASLSILELPARLTCVSQVPTIEFPEQRPSVLQEGVDAVGQCVSMLISSRGPSWKRPSRVMEVPGLMSAI